MESSQTTGNITTTVTNDDLIPINADASIPDVKEKASLSTVLWYTILVAAGTFILVLFIKAFIDAGDVEVSLLYLALDIVRHLG